MKPSVVLYTLFNTRPSMMLPASFKPSPWDRIVFGAEAHEITDLSRDALQAATRTPGHYTVRVDPLASKQMLHECGFYYCDTLAEPHCTPDRFTSFENPEVHVSRNVKLEALLGICDGAFSYGRFHRDFKLLRAQADIRYNNWLAQLHDAGNVYGLQYRGELVAFMAVSGNRLVLHAIAELFRGQGLAKFLWTPVCRELFNQGCAEVVSSVSLANLAIVNLYATLGFRFRNPVDLYHRLTD